MHKELKGISISKGIAIGEAYKIIKLTKEISYERIGESAVEAEKARFLNALEQTREQVNALSKHMRDKHEDQKAEIIETQLTILEDPEIEDSVCAKIADERKNAEWALKETHQALQEMFSEFEDERMRERLSDINDVCSQIMGQLQGGTVGQSGGLPDSCVIVAEELTPSETVSLDFDKTAGFLTHVGGATSHMAIISRSMGIPAIAGIADVMHEVNSGDTVILDATIGMVIVNPDEGELRAYEEKKKELEHRKVLLEKLRDLPALTKDGVRVELCANIGSTKDAETAIVCGGDGVGLCRTEFLYMNNTHFPTEEEQFAAYRTIAQTLKGKPVVVRTLDIGGDKDLSYFEFEKEDNPFLGWRAIRICLDRTDIFKTQLRAILRAGAYGNLRLMYPMIIAKEELMRANEILEECKSELSAEGEKFCADISVGIMVETPAAVVMAETLAKYVDFFSIGTNDLCQYTLAVDRGNPKLAERYNPFHPAVLRSIKKVIDAAHGQGKLAAMCGEMAGDARAVRLLLGMGLDEFSMTAVCIPSAKEIVMNTDTAKAKLLAEKALTMETTEEVLALLESNV